MVLFHKKTTENVCMKPRVIDFFFSMLCNIIYLRMKISSSSNRLQFLRYTQVDSTDSSSVSVIVFSGDIFASRPWQTSIYFIKSLFFTSRLKYIYNCFLITNVTIHKAAGAARPGVLNWICKINVFRFRITFVFALFFFMIWKDDIAIRYAQTITTKRMSQCSRASTI